MTQGGRQRVPTSAWKEEQKRAPRVFNPRFPGPSAPQGKPPLAAVKPTIRRTLAEQTAQHLREGIAAGRWRGSLPALRPLAADTGVSVNTLRAALALLVREGLLAPGAPRAPMRLAPGGGAPRMTRARPLSIGVLLPRPLESESGDTRALILSLQDALHEQGHLSTTIPVSGRSAKRDADFVKRLLREHAEDVWIVYQGTTEVLARFARQTAPVLALAGRGRDAGVPTVDCDASPAMSEAVRQLVSLGHRRIVALCPPRSLAPTRAPFVEAFLRALREAGIATGDFNAPTFEDTPEGLHALLDSLFRVTPPTALIAVGNHYVAGTLTFLASRGLRVPREVSLVSADSEASFAWQVPELRIAHFDDRRNLIVKNLCRWLDDIASGRPPHPPKPIAARLIPGNSLGAPPRPAAPLRPNP